MYIQYMITKTDQNMLKNSLLIHIALVNLYENFIFIFQNSYHLSNYLVEDQSEGLTRNNHALSMIVGIKLRGGALKISLNQRRYFRIRPSSSSPVFRRKSSEGYTQFYLFKSATQNLGLLSKILINQYGHKQKTK
jgi:hypothetical protein